MKTVAWVHHVQKMALCEANFEDWETEGKPQQDLLCHIHFGISSAQTVLRALQGLKRLVKGMNKER